MNNNVANECKINLEKKLFRQKRVAIFEACLPSLQTQHGTISSRCHSGLICQ